MLRVWPESLVIPSCSSLTSLLSQNPPAGCPVPVTDNKGRVGLQDVCRVWLFSTLASGVRQNNASDDDRLE